MSRILRHEEIRMLHLLFRIPKCALPALCAVLLTVQASAQTVTGTITGTAVDSSGAVIVSARVVVTDEGTRLERQAMTGEEGSFVLVGLPPGKYSVRLEMQGFRPITRSSLVLTASQRLSIGTIEM